MNPVIETILARTGTKTYRPDPVPREDLALIVRAGIAAPNAYNAQKWHFSVVTDRALLDELEEKAFQKLVETGVCEAGEDYAPFYRAPAVIVLSASSDHPFGAQDCSAANENMAIAAKSLGLGSRFLDVPNQFFHAPEGASVKARLGVPEGYETVCFLSVGYPVDAAEQPTEKRSDVVTFVE